MFATLMCALVIAADDAEPAPKASPPVVVLASVKDGHLVSRVTQVVAVPVTVIKKVEKNGKVEDVPFTTIKTEQRVIERKQDLSKATFGTAGGKKLTADEAKKRLEKVQPVVLSGDGRAVDAAYLKVFDKDALVIVMPIELVVPAVEAPGDFPAPPKKQEKQ